MNPLTRQDTPPSIHSWWSDSNPGLRGPTVNLHAAAKPLMKFMYHRQTLEFIRKNRGSPLSKDVLETYSSYLPWDFVSRGTKIAILSELANRTDSDVEARAVVDSPVLEHITRMLRSPDTQLRGASRMLLRKLASHECTAPAVLELNLSEQLVYVVGEDDPIIHPIIPRYESTDDSLLKHLPRYHKYQTRLLSEIFSKIEDNKRVFVIAGSSSKNQFLTDMIVAINRDIRRLERTLKGGLLAVWFQFEESQQELTEIQLTLARYEASDWTPKKLEKINKRIADARAKDEAVMAEEVGNLVKKFRSNGQRIWQRPPEHYLEDLFPELKHLPGNNEVYRMFAFQSFLDKFTTNPLGPVSTLINELNMYVDIKLDSIQWGRPRAPSLQLQFIRKLSGTIITVLHGSRSRDDIRRHYFGDVEHENKLPILYTARSLGDTQGEFVGPQYAIQHRPDSRRYVEWKHGEAPSTDIYLVEKMAGNPFILVTLLGSDVNSDLVKLLPRDGLAVKHAICPSTEDPWITEDGWEHFGMHHLRCNSPRLQDYSHQIFLPGPPTLT
ncbi:hypothetical protein MVEN_02447500 [Mycena venus]|uniref:Uncharacterized protein n=1 Tax=Mycena venus TaxID=2733690 RepID=A0A8H6WYT8_9AGAR|nr:hypothetical protein MVEN_02447500 [Mycena venus]